MNVKLILHFFLIVQLHYSIAMENKKINSIFKKSIPKKNSEKPSFDIIKELQSSSWYIDLIEEIKIRTLNSNRSILENFFSLVNSTISQEAVANPAISPDGEKIFFPYSSKLYSADGILLKKTDLMFDCAIFDSSSCKLAICNRDFLIILDLIKEKIIKKITYTIDKPEALAWSANASILAIQEQSRIHLFYVDLNKSWLMSFFLFLKHLGFSHLPDNLQNNYKMNYLIFSPDSLKIACIDSTGRIIIVDLLKSLIIDKIQTQSNPNFLIWSSDSKNLYMKKDNYYIYNYTIATKTMSCSTLSESPLYI